VLKNVAELCRWRSKMLPFFAVYAIPQFGTWNAIAQRDRLATQIAGERRSLKGEVQP